MKVKVTNDSEEEITFAKLGYTPLVSLYQLIKNKNLHKILDKPEHLPLPCMKFQYNSFCYNIHF
jgi:hypothetical protein